MRWLAASRRALVVVSFLVRRGGLSRRRRTRLRSPSKPSAGVIDECSQVGQQPVVVAVLLIGLIAAFGELGARRGAQCEFFGGRGTVVLSWGRAEDVLRGTGFVEYGDVGEDHHFLDRVADLGGSSARSSR